MRFGRRVYTSFHGVQMESPRANERPILNTTTQMIYHRYVSKKNSTKSMIYMIVSANGTWLLQSAVPKNLSLHPWTFVRAMTAMGLLKDEVRKKYDSVSLHPKISAQRRMEAARADRVSEGYDAVKVCEAMYFRDFPATRSPNMRPEGIRLNEMVATTDTKNWTMPMMSGILDVVDLLSTIAI